MLHYHYVSPSHYGSRSLSLTYTHSKNTMQRDTCRCRRVPPPTPHTVFDDEMFAHHRSEIEKQNLGGKMERARHKGSEFSLMSSYSPSRLHIVFGEEC